VDRFKTINLDLRSTSPLAPCQSKVEKLKGWRDDGIRNGVIEVGIEKRLRSIQTPPFTCECVANLQLHRLMEKKTETKSVAHLLKKSFRNVQYTKGPNKV